MNNIGNRIRELRRRNDLTQEKLADLLGVTYQSVSKWECGVTFPDLAMIGPLTKLLHVTSDELLGLTKETVDARYDERKKACEQAVLDGGERDGFRKIYDTFEALVREYPGDMESLCEFAWAGSNRAWNFEDRAVFREEQERAARQFATVIENTSDERLKANAIRGIVQVYSFLGESERARPYIDLLPDEPAVTKDSVAEILLRGEELRAYRQRKLEGHLRKLTSGMVFCSVNPLQAVTDAESILGRFFPDGDYTGFHEAMYRLQYRKAVLLTGEGRFGEAVDALRSCKTHAVLADEEERAGGVHTSPYFDLLTVDACSDEPCGNPSHTETFFIEMTDGVLNPLRGREDFRELFGE